MRIVTLVENVVYNKDLGAEHGISIFLHHEDLKIIFDTGQSDLFCQNAEQLGIDIADIDVLILSHGHYDHVGGLKRFLELNQKAKIIAKEGIFRPKYKRDRYVGIDPSITIPADRLHIVHEVEEICPGIFVCPDTTIYNQADTHYEGFEIKEQDEMIPDEFEDELFLAIKHDNMLNILSSCSHRGIINMLETAVRYFKLPVNMVIGGFHTKEASLDSIHRIYQYFNKHKVKQVGVCHCTGINNYVILKKNFKRNVFYNCTGFEIWLN